MEKIFLKMYADDTYSPSFLYHEKKKTTTSPFLAYWETVLQERRSQNKPEVALKWSDVRDLLSSKMRVMQCPNQDIDAMHMKIEHVICCYSNEMIITDLDGSLYSYNVFIASKHGGYANFEVTEVKTLSTLTEQIQKLCKIDNLFMDKLIDALLQSYVDAMKNAWHPFHVLKEKNVEKKI